MVPPIRILEYHIQKYTPYTRRTCMCVYAYIATVVENTLSTVAPHRTPYKYMIVRRERAHTPCIRRPWSFYSVEPP